MLRLAVILACHNRRNCTTRCLSSLLVQKADVDISIYLLDDGSSDGTAEAALTFPNVHILYGDGTLYWNRGMHTAFAAAMADKYDAYLWLNDDVSLDSDALQKLLLSYSRIQTRCDCNLIIVGSTRDPISGKVTYGGLSRRGRLRPLAFTRVEPDNEEIEVDTMNGNFVLIPDSTARALGNLDPSFHHKWGDMDYGLRARATGARIWLMPGTIGLCSHVSETISWKAPGIGIRARWARMNSHTGLHWSSWVLFASRHGGPLWPVYVCWAYRRIVWPER
jgi:GT2 family glycosyltransferase